MSQTTFRERYDVWINRSLVVTAGVFLHQPLTAVFYATLAVWPAWYRLQWFGDYIHEYLMWRYLLPTHAFTVTEVLANVAAAVVITSVVAWVVVNHDKMG